MPDPQYLSTDPNAGEYLSTDPNAGTPVQAPAEPPSGGIGRVASTFWDEANPLTAISGIIQAAKDPKAALAAAYEAHKAVKDKAVDEYNKGNYQDAAVHAFNAAIPFLGPKIDELAERGARGDWAGLIGGAAGVGASLKGPQAAVGAVKAIAKVPAILPAAVADTAEAMSTKRMVDVMAPKGLSKSAKQLGNVAEKVAPQIAREPGLMSVSRQGLAEAVGSKLDEAADALDQANAARPNTRIPTAPVLADLQQQRARFATSGGKVPEPFVERVSQIDNAIKEVRRLGPQASYDDLKVIRQAYDDRAKATYNAATTPNYGQALGQKQGAGDVAASIRSRLATADPATAEANARYSLFKNARDVMQATEEVERTKAKVGRQMMAKGLGAATGGELGGMPGMVAGYVLAPIIDSAVSSGVTTKIATARMLAQLADAVRSGKPAQVNSAILRLASLTGKTAQVRALMQSGAGAAVPLAAQDQTGTTP